MFNGTLGYAVGQTVYKYSPELPTDVQEHDVEPTSFALLHVYPNPFNAQATIEYSIAGGADDPATPIDVSIKIYDLLGKEVETIVDEAKRAGTYKAYFDGSNLSTGIYIARMLLKPGADGAPTLAGTYVDSKKLLLLK
jgi:hypothetical protein